MAKPRTKVTMGSCALGVHDTLRDAFAVKVAQLVKQVEVLEQNRAKLAGGQGVLVVIDRVAYV